MKETSTHYLVLVKIRKQPKFPQHPEWVYLAVDNGYCSHSSSKMNAHYFEEVPTQEIIDAYSGMPWADVHDKRMKPKIFKVTVTREEEELSSCSGK